MEHIDMTSYENGLRLQGRLQHDLAVSALKHLEEPTLLADALEEYSLCQENTSGMTYNLLFPATYRAQLRQALTTARTQTDSDSFTRAGYDEMLRII